MSEKKKILFYTYLSSGHLNVTSAFATILLNNHSEEIEIYFLTDEIWAEKLNKIDSRYKFRIYQSLKRETNKNVSETMNKLENSLSLSYNERIKELYKTLFSSPDGYVYGDEQILKIIIDLQPNYIICDLLFQMPSVISSNIPHSFIVSCNPLVTDVEDFPLMGLDVNTNDKEKIRFLRQDLEDSIKSYKKNFELVFDKMNVKYDKKYPMFAPRSDHMSIYCYPQELDYFNDEIRENYKLLQVDSPLITSKIPPPYELPEEFIKLPGKIIYVSLGSLFSSYYTKLQKLIDILAQLPYKYIVSKGPNGDKIKFPNDRFIGENYINQLAVLQVVDIMISHGGNNTFTECFYFGVPSIIMPIMADQINNAIRIEETGFGFHINLSEYTKEELEEKIEKVLTNESLYEKLKKISNRIKSENKLEKVVEKFYEYLKKI